MSRPHVLLALGAVLLTWPASLSAQFMRKPTAEDRRLAFLAGDWVVESTMYIRGESHRRTTSAKCYWVVEALWLQCDSAGNFPDGRRIQTSEWLTWDQTKGHYRSYHIDPQLTEAIRSIGRWTEDGTLEFEANFVWRDGNTYYTRETIRRREDGSVERTNYMSTDPDPERFKLNGKSIFRRTQAKTDP